MERYSRIALVLVILLVVIASIAIFFDMQTWRGRRAEDMRIFQRATGGLGVGAIATPIWNFINYDLRVFSVDDSMTWPVPGGYSYGPDRTATVSYFEEVSENQWTFPEP
jgi:uncharacterized membrane protein